MDTQISHIPCFAITGHHRSATSLVASLLQSAGLNVGERLLGADPSNKHGHYEDLDFLNFHIDVLKSQGFGFEGYILDKAIQVQEQYVARAQEMIAARMRLGKPWAWKDPRTTLFLDFWNRLIPHLGFVCLFRAPWEVVDSQFRRGHETFRTNPNWAVQVWISYNQAILDFADRCPAQCLLLEGPAIGVNPALLGAAMAKKFDLNLGPMENRFDREILVRHDSSHLPLVIRHFFPEAIEIYEKLRARAEVVVSEKALRSHSQTSGAALDWALQHWYDLRETDRKLRTTQSELEQTHADVQRIQAQATAAEEDLKQHLEQTRADVRRVQAQATAAEGDLKQHKANLECALSELKQIRQSQEETRQQLCKLQEANATTEQELQERHKLHVEQQSNLDGLRIQLEETLHAKANAEAKLEHHIAQLQEAQALAEQLRHEKERAETRIGEHLAHSQEAQAAAEEMRRDKEQLESQLGDAQLVIEELRRAKEQAEAIARQLIRDKELADALGIQHQDSDAEAQSKLLHTSAELERTSLLLDHSQDLVRRMESSKFWKLRRAWFKVKRQVYKRAG